MTHNIRGLLGDPLYSKCAILATPDDVFIARLNFIDAQLQALKVQLDAHTANLQMHIARQSGTCFICRDWADGDNAGLQSTGDINNPVWRWICNKCVRSHICP